MISSMLCVYKGSAERESLVASDCILRPPLLILSKPRTTGIVSLSSVNMEVQRKQKGKFLSTIVF